MRLLLAEDERELAHALEAVFLHNHYSVDLVYNGADAFDWADAGDYDGMILDIMMPKMSGLEVLKALRKKGNPVPVLLLTAKSEVDDRVLGLDLGADDYLPKPFAMKELLARVRAMTRRRAERESNTLEFEGMTLDRESFELVYKNQAIRLGSKEYQMLEMMMRTPGAFISAEQFIGKIWGYDSETEMNAVWVYLSNLRKKMQSLQIPVCIKAARGIGYRLEKEEKDD